MLTHLDVPQAGKLWKEFATPYQERLKEVLAPAFVQLLVQAGGFSADSVGSRMQTDFVAVRTETKVSELIARLKNLPRNKIPPVCFVTGKKEELKGTIRTVELAFFDPQTVCGSVMNKTLETLKPQDSLETAQSVFGRLGIEVFPVVNDECMLVGILWKETLLTAVSAPKSWWKKLKQ